MATEHRTTEELKESISERNERIEAGIDRDIIEAKHWYGSWGALRMRIQMLEQNESEAAYDRAYDPERQ